MTQRSPSPHVPAPTAPRQSGLCGDAHWAAFLAQTDDGYLTYSTDYRILSINPGGLRLLGLSDDTPIIGQTCTLVLGDQAADVEPFLEEVLETGNKVYVEHAFWVHGQSRSCEGVYTPVRNAKGSIVEIIGIYRDLTPFQELQRQRDRNLEQRAHQAEARLRLLEDQKRQTEEQLRASFTHGPVAKALIGKDGKVLQVNPALCQLVGYTEAELKHHKVSDLTHPDDHPIDYELWQSLIHNGGISDQREKRLIHKTGHAVWILVSIVWVKQHENDAKPSFYITEMQNLTQLKETEVALTVAKQNAEAATRAKSAFLAMMSHEIRTPMNAVIGSAELLRQTSLDAQQADYIQTICTGGETLLSVIDDILDFSKIEAGKLDLVHHPFSVQNCIEAALDMVRGKAIAKGLELIVAVDSKIPEAVMGDRNRLRQILVNLLGNAVKFTEVGEVLISATVGARPTQKQTTYQLNFTVQDTGIGIAPEQQTQLFQSFQQADTSITRRYGGTGLGLAICKRLCELMQGEISVESQVGRGTTFHFAIQVEKVERVDPKVQHPYRSLPAFQDQHVLLVDDNATNRRILGQQLADWGLQVTLAASGPEALTIMETGQTFEIALIDMQMPGMDGWALTAKLQQQQQHLPIVLLGAVTGRLEKWPTVVAMLSKPVKMAQLQPLLRRTLRPLRILVAEDNPVNQKVALRLLERLGYTADVVENGQDVLETLQTKGYDVVFLDVHMPKLDGFAVANQIRQWPDRPYLIAMTADAMSNARQTCLAAGMDDYISKPVHLQDLSDALAPCLPGVSRNLGI